MENIRVHPRGFKFLFFLYHGLAAAGFILIAGFLSQIIPYNMSLISGMLMIAIPFLLIPPELIILLKDQKLIFRHRISCSTISFADIARVDASVGSVEIKDRENQTLMQIHKKHFKNINLSELSEYLRDLLSGHRKVDPTRFAAIKFTGCRFLD